MLHEEDFLGMEDQTPSQGPSPPAPCGPSLGVCEKAGRAG